MGGSGRIWKAGHPGSPCSGRGAGPGELGGLALGARHLGSRPSSGRVVGPSKSEQGELGAWTPGFLPNQLGVLGGQGGSLINKVLA